ncbi:MAG: hypothetical protein WDM71_05800 [Ferruginibacter sp.]
MNASFAQQQTPEEYIAKYKDLAINEMKRMGVPCCKLFISTGFVGNRKWQ